jgi:mycothiol synthase
MIWPARRLGAPPRWELPIGYALRTFRPGDEEDYARLMQSVGFPFARDDVPRWVDLSLPDGLFFVVHEASGQLVATAGAFDRPLPDLPGGELGWVAVDPAWRGLGLGYIVSAAVIGRFLTAGFTTIYLLTDDFRLPAIKTYLKLGMVPLLCAPDMEARWRAVCEQLAWDFVPDCCMVCRFL